MESNFTRDTVDQLQRKFRAEQTPPLARAWLSGLARSGNEEFVEVCSIVLRAGSPADFRDLRDALLKLRNTDNGVKTDKELVDLLETAVQLVAQDWPLLSCSYNYLMHGRAKSRREILPLDHFSKLVKYFDIDHTDLPNDDHFKFCMRAFTNLEVLDFRTYSRKIKALKEIPPRLRALAAHVTLDTNDFVEQVQERSIPLEFLECRLSDFYQSPESLKQLFQIPTLKHLSLHELPNSEDLRDKASPPIHSALLHGINRAKCSLESLSIPIPDIRFLYTFSPQVLPELKSLSLYVTIDEAELNEESLTWLKGFKLKNLSLHSELLPESYLKLINLFDLEPVQELTLFAGAWPRMFETGCQFSALKELTIGLPIWGLADSLKSDAEKFVAGLREKTVNNRLEYLQINYCQFSEEAVKQFIEMSWPVLETLDISAGSPDHWADNLQQLNAPRLIHLRLTNIILDRDSITKIADWLWIKQIRRLAVRFCGDDDELFELLNLIPAGQLEYLAVSFVASRPGSQFIELLSSPQFSGLKRIDLFGSVETDWVENLGELKLEALESLIVDGDRHSFTMRTHIGRPGLPKLVNSRGRDISFQGAKFWQASQLTPWLEQAEKNR